MHRPAWWIAMFWVAGVCIAIAVGFGFFYAFNLIECFGFTGYTVPYSAKRIALSVSTALATLKAYTLLLAFLFSDKKISDNDKNKDNRRWLTKRLMLYLGAEQVSTVKGRTSKLPAWYHFGVLYLFAFVLALL